MGFVEFGVTGMGFVISLLHCIKKKRKFFFFFVKIRCIPGSIFHISLFSYNPCRGKWLCSSAILCTWLREDLVKMFLLKRSKNRVLSTLQRL